MIETKTLAMLIDWTSVIIAVVMTGLCIGLWLIAVVRRLENDELKKQLEDAGGLHSGVSGEQFETPGESRAKHDTYEAKEPIL